MYLLEAYKSITSHDTRCSDVVLCSVANEVVNEETLHAPWTILTCPALKLLKPIVSTMTPFSTTKVIK